MPTDQSDWELEEYRQLSEDFRNYGTQGWQIPLATLGIDALFVTASVTVLYAQVFFTPFSLSVRYFISAIILLASVALTVLIYKRMEKWETRTKNTKTDLEDISKGKPSLRRFVKPESDELQKKLREQLLLFMIGIAIALFIAAVALVILGVMAS